MFYRRRTKLSKGSWHVSMMSGHISKTSSATKPNGAVLHTGPIQKIDQAVKCLTQNEFGATERLSSQPRPRLSPRRRQLGVTLESKQCRQKETSRPSNRTRMSMTWKGGKKKQPRRRASRGKAQRMIVTALAWELWLRRQTDRILKSGGKLRKELMEPPPSTPARLVRRLIPHLVP